MSRVLSLLLIAASSVAIAAPPSVSGRPQYTFDPPGPVLTGERGDVGLKVRVEEGPLRAVLFDVRGGASADAVIAELRVEALKDGEAMPLTVSSLSFGPDVVHAQMGDVDVRLHRATEAGFAVSVHPLAGDYSLRVTVEATGAQGSTEGTLVVKEGLAFALRMSGTGARTVSGGDGFIELSAPAESFGDLAFVAIGTGTSESAARASAEALGPDLLAESGQRVIDAAMGVLRSNEAPTGGFFAHRGQRNLHWTWESAWQAWAMALVEPDRALEALEAHRRGQVHDESVERGLRHARVDGQGAAPALNGGPGTTEFFTRIAPFGFAMRALQDASLEDRNHRLGPLVDWSLDAFDWTARRRDRDEDFRYEINGAIEHPQGDSPRFTAFWSAQDAQLPLAEGGAGRIPLDAVDLNAWLAHETLEAWRLAVALGHPKAEDARNRSFPLAGRLLHPEEGHWSAPDGVWFDYVRRGANRDRDFGGKVRTPASWAPLSAGLVRDGAQVRDAVTRHVLDPLFFTSKGIAAYAGGPISPTDSMLTLVALSRYGWETEAQLLRERLIALLDSHPNLHALYTPDGAPIGPAGDGAAAGVAILAALRADEAEVFAMQEGNPAAARSGHFKRVFRASDGRVAYELTSVRSLQPPKTTLRAETQLFSDEPMTLRIEAEGSHAVSLPVFAEVEVVRRVDGKEQRETVKGTDEEGVAIEVPGGEDVELRVVRFAGERGGGCGCSAQAGTGAAWLPLLALAVLTILASRRGRWA